MLASGRGDTALLQAADRGETAVVELLLEANAPLDVKNHEGRGPQFIPDSFGFPSWLLTVCLEMSGDRNL